MNTHYTIKLSYLLQLFGIKKEELKSIYYVSCVPIGYSFESFRKVCSRLFKHDLDFCEILIADNLKGTRRKIIARTKHSWTMVYVAIDNGGPVFHEITNAYGPVKKATYVPVQEVHYH